MSTTTVIRCTRDTYVNTTGNNYDSATALYANCTSKDANSRTATALLQFALPSTLKYKKILSAVLNFSFDVTLTGSGAGYNQVNFYYAPFSASASIAGITGSNLSTYGAYGTATNDLVQYNITGGSYSSTRSVDVVSLLQNNTYNDLFTFSITAHRLLTSNSTIKSTENASGYPTLTIVYEDIAPTADTPIYPLDVFLNQSDAITFRWKFNSASQTTQASFVLKWKKSTDSTYTTLASGGTDLKYTAPANTFPVGKIDWSITSTDIFALTTPTAYGSFTVVGKPSAPIITNVENDALTTIQWNTPEQSARELQLLSNGAVIDSDKSSTPDASYSPKMFLKNGTYEFRIRIVNSYGYWSDWTSYTFTLSATTPTIPTLTYTVDHGNIVLEVVNGSGRVFIYRYEKDLAVPIAEITESTYTDKTFRFNTQCRYFARSYNVGIADSNEISVRVSLDGFTLSTQDDIVRIVKSEEQEMPLNESYQTDKVLNYYDGRELPVLDAGEHTTHQIDRRFFVANSDKEVFNRILKSKTPILYRDSSGDKFYCSTSNHSSSSKDIHNGRIHNLTFIETYYDEAVILNG